MRDWLQRATTEQKEEFYEPADTSYCSMWQVGAGRWVRAFGAQPFRSQI